MNIEKTFTYHPPKEGQRDVQRAVMMANAAIAVNEA